MFDRPLAKFLDSMAIGYMQWHDGDGYDLAALDKLNERDRVRAEDALIARRGADWRDVEALARLGSPRALGALRTYLESPDVVVRVESASRLAERGLLPLDVIENVALAAMRDMTMRNGMTWTLRFVEAHQTERIRRELLRCARDGHDDVRVHSAALALFLYGKAATAFDPAFRDIYFKFRTPVDAERAVAYRELCALVGVDAHS